MSVFLKKWRKQGILVFVYLDDIFLVAQSKVLTQKHLSVILEDLQNSGMTVNEEKSVLSPNQKLEHLGFIVNLEEGRLEVPTPKLKSVRKELGKFVTHKALSCRKVTAILGQVRSFLTALPFLRAFTDQLVQFSSQHRWAGWDQPLEITPQLKEQVKEIGLLLQTWEGRQFGGKTPVWTIHSDSSTEGWGAIDITSGRQLQEFWRTEKGLHINIKELKAAISAVQSLARPGETVHLAVENQVAYSYLRKGGGRLPHFNGVLRPFLKWCQANHLNLVPNWVRSEDMLADGLSRWAYDKRRQYPSQKLFPPFD